MLKKYVVKMKTNYYFIIFLLTLQKINCNIKVIRYFNKEKKGN